MYCCRSDTVTTMKPHFMSVIFAALLATAIASAPVGLARTQQSDANQLPTAPPSMHRGAQASPRGTQSRGRPVIGKISAIQNDSMELISQDGTKVSVKLDGSTEFRKDRQPAKLSDFKVGDTAIVRTNQDGGDSSGSTARMVALAPPGFTGREGGAGVPGGMAGTMGKDFVMGEVKTVDPPRLTILRTDNVTQTLELNEETSLRRGRDSITMADIQPGDHVFARGAVANDAFVPKSLNLILPEQWKRTQEMNEANGTRGPTPQQNSAPPSTQDLPPGQPN
jgi:Domain of unknown function (DUF5666)